MMVRFLVLVALGCVVFAGAARACSCAWDTSAADAFAAKDFVFTAKVVGAVEPGEPDKVVWTLAVEQVFKGDVPPRFEYESSRHFCAWRRFKPGRSYLIYADAAPRPDTQNIMGISDCSRTKAAGDAADEIKLLDDLAGQADRAGPDAAD